MGGPLALERLEKAIWELWHFGHIHIENRAHLWYFDISVPSFTTCACTGNACPSKYFRSLHCALQLRVGNAPLRELYSNADLG